MSGVSLDREAAAPGDPFLLSLYWQVNEAPLDDAEVKLSLINEQDETVFVQDLPPVRADFPTNQWWAGDAWLGQHAFRLPLALESGDYVWTLQWCVADDCEEEVVLGKLVISAPERLFTPPAVCCGNGRSTGRTGYLARRQSHRRTRHVANDAGVAG
ncbi:MAG: hypothetical protein M5U34_42910 [Chloroflexi bacterium]|nr:hypothetical protein [Chloroflexota bacterium]